MKRIIAAVLAGLVLVLLTAFNLSPYGRIYLASGTGIVAKQMCSLVFVSGLEADQAKRLYLDPLLGDAAPLIAVNLDDDRREVRSAVLGLWRQRAVMREGLGCTLVHDGRDFDAALSLPPAAEFQPFELDPAHRDAHFDNAALAAAVEGAFDGTTNDRRNTLGVAVFHRGNLVAEHYAAGASRETRFHGWSMTKSWAATLAGVMAQTGELDITAEDQVPALAAAGDDRGNVTIEHLLRMAGGFELHEYNNGIDPNSRMLFTQRDMARFAATQRRLHAPGEHWEYMSGNTVLATHAMQTRLGDTLAEQVTAVRTRLFEPLGMYSAIIETDETGTFQGSSYMYATAHDWARLALLYMNDGVVDGQRLLPEDWYEIVARPTPGSGGEYGMGFWLPRDGDGLPPETIMMSGFQGQWAYIMPVQELVIVRFGATNGVNSRSGRLAVEVLASLAAQDS